MKFYNADIKDNDKVELVHFSLDRDDGAALDWAKKERFPFYSILKGDQGNLPIRGLGGGGIPAYVLIDRDGKVITRGSQSCKDTIKSL